MTAKRAALIAAALGPVVMVRAADLEAQFQRASAGTGLVVLEPGAKPDLVPLSALAPAKTRPSAAGELAPIPAPPGLDPTGLQQAVGVAFALGLNRVCLPTVDASGKQVALAAQPYWPMCEGIATETARIAAVLAQGEPVADIAVLHVPDASALEEIAQSLIRSQLDFRMVEPTALAASRIEGAALVIDGARYTRLVLPPMETIEPAPLDKVEAFVKAGGVVMAIRQLPGGDAAARIQAIFGIAPGAAVEQDITAKGSAYFVKQDIGRLTATLRNMAPDVFLYPPSRDVLCCHRRIGGTDVYFITNQSREPFHTYATIRRFGEPELWDPRTGQTRTAYGYDPQDKNVIVPLVLDPYQNLLIVFRRPLDERRIRHAPGLEQLTVQERGGKLIARGIAGMNGAYTIATADGRRGRAGVRGLPEPLAIEGAWSFKPEEPYQRQPSEVVAARCRATRPGDDTRDWMKPEFDDARWDLIKIGRPLPSLQAQWHAHWLLYSGDGEVRYFRRTFDLPARPREASLTITADNGYELHVNGEKIGGDNDWYKAETYPIADKLKQGRNAIAVRTTNEGPIAGFLAEARIALPSGEVERIVTDQTWKMAREPGDEWQAVDFDDSKWSPPDVGEMPPCDPWGDVPGLPPEPQTGRELWYRFDLPPGASRLRLPEGAREARLYVDGKPVKVVDGVADLTGVPLADRTKAVLVVAGPEPLQPPITADCEAGAILTGSWTTQGFPTYSGVGTYWRTLRIPPEYAKEHLFLDLGQVGCAAKVLVNGKECGVCAFAPYRSDIAHALKKGDNQVKVFVANTLANAHGHPETPSGILGPVELVPYRDVEAEVR